MQVHPWTSSCSRVTYGAFFLTGGSGTSSPSSLQRNCSCPSFCFSRVPASAISHTFCSSQTIGWTNCSVAKTDSLALVKFSSSLAASMSASSTAGPTGCCQIFAASLEKNEDTCIGVRNSAIANRRSPFESFSRRIALATTSGSILCPVSCPMLNLSTR